MIDLNTPIYNIDQSPAISKIKVTVMKEVKGELIENQELQDKPVTLGAMLVHSVLKSVSDTSVGTITTKYNLWKKLNVPEESDGTKMVELPKEDIEMLKQLVCDAVEIFYAGQIMEILNNQ
jgi:hypothetical protein